MRKILRGLLVIVLLVVLCCAIWQLTIFIGVGNAGNQPGPGLFIDSLK